VHDLDPADPDDRDPDAGGVIIAPETLRALLGQPRHRPARVVWSGADSFDSASTTTAAAYVAYALAQLARQNGM
jgi:hypothetical protein